MAALTLPPAVDLSIGAAAELRERWLALIDDAPSDAALTLSLDSVADIDSAGVQLLLALRHSARAEGRVLRLQGGSGPVREALATFGLQNLVDDRKE